MRSISLPGLVLWLPLGSPAACPKHSVSTSRIRTFSLRPLRLASLAHCDSGATAARLKEFPECTTMCSHCRCLQRSILKPPLPLSVPHSADIPFLTRLHQGATGNPCSSFRRLIAFYNLRSFLPHRHAPSHSYTGVIIALCRDLLLPVNAAAP